MTENSKEITTELIKQLRDKTGISVMQCKKALEETSGDMEKAVMLLQKKSADIASKKSEREDARVRTGRARAGKLSRRIRATRQSCR